MREIAERIEYSPTTIYLYFKDKAELFERICEETFAKLIDRIDEDTREAKDPVEGLVLGSRAYIDFGVEHPHHYLATFSVRPDFLRYQD